MNKFKTGDYVVSMHDFYHIIYKVVEKQNENQVLVEYDNCGCKSHAILGIKTLRRATVLDYIRTLNDCRMADFVTSCCYIFRDLDSDSIYNCTVYITEFLNEPLTDKIVDKLGGD